jgi:hypothetical protein
MKPSFNKSNVKDSNLEKNNLWQSIQLNKKKLWITIFFLLKSKIKKKQC